MPADPAAPRPDARAILRAAGALDGRFRVRARLDGDYPPATQAYKAFAEAANPVAVAALCRMLLRLEWERWYAPLCPVCGNHRDHGHRTGCELAAILGEAPDARP